MRNISKSVVLFSLMLSWGWVVLSQSQNTLAGQVLDSSSLTPVPFVTVAIFSSSGDLINGTISTKDGRFIIQGIGAGDYQLRLSSIGFGSFVRSVHIGKLNDHYDLGRLLISPQTTQLEEIVITGEKEDVSQGLDRKEFRMSDNIAQSGGSIMDAMKAMPGVTFDQEGKVILRGSDRVIVLIDGKPSSLTGFGNQKGLDNIPVANVERIEIINNPSAKYDANGMAGIINIIYKDDSQFGLHGSVGFGYGLGALSKRKTDLPTDLGSYSPTPKYIPSLDLQLRKEKINFFLQSEVFFQERLPNNEFTTRYYDDGRTIASQVPENRTQKHYIVKGGLEYFWNDLNSLTFSGIYDWERHTDTAQVAYINQDDIRTRYITWNEDEITGYMNYALRFEHSYFQPGHKLNADLQYSRGWEDETYYLNDSSSVRSNGRDITSVLGTEHIVVSSLDYTRPMTSGRWETGAKIRVRNLPVEYEQIRDTNSMLYDGLGNWSKWGENLYAGYLNWVFEKTNYDVEGGLRAEYTSVFYDMDESNDYYSSNDQYDYFKLFPNIRFTLNLNTNNRLSVFYNQRIDRPGEPELRMYSKSDDHELVKVGNPYLRPQYTKLAELAIQHYWNQGSIFLSGYYRSIHHAFQRVYTQDTSSQFNVIVKTYANTGRMEHFGAEILLSQQITPFWKLSGNFNYFKIDIHGHTGNLLFPYSHTFEIGPSAEGTWDAKMTNTLNFTDGLEAQITGLYMADRNIPQGMQFSRSSIDIGLKMKVWEGKGELSLAITDLLNRYGLRQQIVGVGFMADYENYYETQTIRTSFKYSF